MKMIKQIQPDAATGERWALVYDAENPSATRIAVLVVGSGELAAQRAMRAAVVQFWSSVGGAA